MGTITKSDDSVPETLRPYIFHGVDLQYSKGDKQALADCPWCGRENKFAVAIDTGLWRCYVCNEGQEGKKNKDFRGGNARVFIRMLWEKSYEQTNTADYRLLADNRRLLEDDTLLQWHLCRSMLTGNWLVPGYGSKGPVNTLYQYGSDGKRALLWPTPTLGHQLGGLNLYDPKKPNVYLLEGPWDAMAFWEAMARAKRTNDGIVPTADRSHNLLEDSSVLFIPAAMIFFESWLELFADKHVYLMCQNDHSKTHPKTGATIPPASYEGMQRIARMLSSHTTPPAEINYLTWGEEGFNPELPSGYDVRDLLAGPGGKTLRPLANRVTALGRVLDNVQPVPAEWLSEASGGLATGNKINCLPCSDWKSMLVAWRKALKWTPGLDNALSVMLAAVVSTRSVGDQLWVKIVGPPSCGKTTLCEALSVCTEFVYSRSTFRGFHSGAQSSDGKDTSMIPDIRNKTFITKDGDTLMKSPNIEQILSEARDLYDSTSRAQYRTGQSKTYTGIRMTWILCGTSSLRSLDQSELGERFLDCVVMDGIDDDLEDEILWRVANRVDRNMAVEADENISTNYEPELLLAMQLTGGYVQYLRNNATEILSTIETPEWALRQCTRLGKFTAYMRARPSRVQGETEEREFGARLVSQHVRLAKCLAAVLNKNSVDKEVMHRVRKVAMDTSRGPTYKMVESIYRSSEGLDKTALSLAANTNQDQTGKLMRFLKSIGVIEINMEKSKNGARTRQNRFILTTYMHRLFAEVEKI